MNCPAAKYGNSSQRVRVARKRELIQLFILILLVMSCLSVASRLQAATMFFEDFEGYHSFPNQIPAYDPVNKGLPLQSEGATEYWYGGRFKTADGGTIDSDLAVQKYGGGSNSSHTGRFEDEAGLLFHVDTQLLTSATLSFSWRTFLADSSDHLRVGYYIGPLNFGGDRFEDFNADFGSNWWNTSWVEVFNTGPSNTWHDFSAALPVGVPSLWIALWMDGDEGDYAKIDNVLVAGSQSLPEPSSLLSAGIGAAMCCGLAARRRVFRRKRSRDHLRDAKGHPLSA